MGAICVAHCHSIRATVHHHINHHIGRQHGASGSVSEDEGTMHMDNDNDILDTGNLNMGTLSCSQVLSAISEGITEIRINT
jgi:hypothetical protein